MFPKKALYDWDDKCNWKGKFIREQSVDRDEAQSFPVTSDNQAGFRVSKPNTPGGVQAGDRLSRPEGEDGFLHSDPPVPVSHRDSKSQKPAGRVHPSPSSADRGRDQVRTPWGDGAVFVTYCFPSRKRTLYGDLWHSLSHSFHERPSPGLFDVIGSVSRPLSPFS